MIYTPQSEIDTRIGKLQSVLEEKGIDGALIVQNIDLFYFSGTAQNAHLYVPASGQPVLMVRKSLDRAVKESPLKNIVPLTSLKKLPEIISAAGCKVPERLGLEMDVLPASSYFFYHEVFQGTRLTDVSNLIRQLRQVKSAYELNLLRKSGRNMNEVFMKIPEIIKEGMTEIELAAQIECAARSKGHMGRISMRSFTAAPFFGHVMSGWTAAVPSGFDGPFGGPGLTPAHPQSGGFKQIGKGEPIVVDYVGLWDGYTTDQTRIYSLGPLPEKLTRAFETALQIQDAIVNRLKPGVNGSDLHQLSLDMAAEAGLSDNFMGYGPDRVRFIGHGTGLELDELPVLAKGLDLPLEEGMVLAIEPKFVFPGEGAVGIENTFALTRDGVEKITITPDDLSITGD